jgi:hypothetical protein
MAESGGDMKLIEVFAKNVHLIKKVSAIVLLVCIVGGVLSDLFLRISIVSNTFNAIALASMLWYVYCYGFEDGRDYFVED